MEKLKMESKDIFNENIEKVAELFPNVVIEAEDGKKIDFDLLRQELSKDIVEGPRERYHLDFPGKREAIVESNRKTNKTLRPIKEKSVNFDTTKNIYIEGDNLEALKILQESYLGKIKCIYIDPPYNTGNDFVYNDDFSHTEKEELQKEGRLDKNGNVMTSKDINNESSGRYHSDWLKMMYPRLKLARNLLSDYGVIFISIDDNEVENLRKLCDEIYGENNFIATICWHKKTQPSFLSKKVSSVKEYILFYAKNNDILTMGGYTDENKLTELVNISNNKCERILKKENVLINNGGFSGVLKKGSYGNANLTIELKETVKVEYGVPDKDLVLYGRFKWNQDKINLSMLDGDIYHIKNISSLRPTIEKRNKEIGIKPILDLLSKKINDEIPTNTDATNELKDMFDGYSIMDYPKPTDLIKYLIRSITFDETSAVVLDFFSGSATTAHAVMKLNAEDGGNRQFVMVQLPEATSEDSEAYKAGYKNICDIGEERIRRAGEKILSEMKKGSHSSPIQIDENGAASIDSKETSKGKIDLDIGFRVYKIDDSNMKDVYYKPDEIDQKTVLDYISNVKEDRTGLDLLTQVMINLGLTLDLTIEEKTIDKNKFYFVEENALVACFDEKIDLESLTKALECKPLKVVCKESSFERDQDKINFNERIKKYSPDSEKYII